MTKNCKCSGRKPGWYTCEFVILVVFACNLSCKKYACTRELTQTMLFRVYDKFEIQGRYTRNSTSIDFCVYFVLEKKSVDTQSGTQNTISRVWADWSSGIRHAEWCLVSFSRVLTVFLILEIHAVWLVKTFSRVFYIFLLSTTIRSSIETSSKFARIARLSIVGTVCPLNHL